MCTALGNLEPYPEHTIHVQGQRYSTIKRAFALTQSLTHAQPDNETFYLHLVCKKQQIKFSNDRVLKKCIISIVDTCV